MHQNYSLPLFSFLLVEHHISPFLKTLLMDQLQALVQQQYTSLYMVLNHLYSLAATSQPQQYSGSMVQHQSMDTHARIYKTQVVARPGMEIAFAGDCRPLHDYRSTPQPSPHTHPAIQFNSLFINPSVSFPKESKSTRSIYYWIWKLALLPQRGAQSVAPRVF